MARVPYGISSHQPDHGNGIKIFFNPNYFISDKPFALSTQNHWNNREDNDSG